ncbi:MAG: roadblock/LC7 domain-containing protein [Thermoplasmata archaeon]|nr:roadblock/LC7 domain-containing protein [Thermoplasmata archaeon]
MEITLRGLIDEIKKIEGVKKVSVISRTGIPLNGDSYENQETFAAMSAIILGAAETAATSISGVKKIIVFLESGDILLILSVGKRGVLSILSTRDVTKDIEHLLDKFRHII